MTRPKVAGRTMSYKQIRAKKSRRGQKAKIPPKTYNEGKNPSCKKRANPQETTISQWICGLIEK